VSTYGMILLFNQGKDAAEAREFAAEWLSERENESCSCVGSWVIGGGWSGELSPLLARFHKEAAKIVPLDECGNCPQKELNEQSQALQKLWEDLGGKETNPLGRDRYDGIYADDVCPLTDCLSVVQSWIEGRPAEIEYLKQQLNEALARNPEANRFTGFCYKVLGMIMLEEFIPEAHVFNISDNDYSVPSDPAGWWAVVCAIH